MGQIYSDDLDEKWVKFKPTLTAAAKAELDQAMLRLIRAFNAANLPNVPYRFHADTVRRVQAVIVETLAIFRAATVERASAPEADAPFQRFMAQISGGAK